MSSPNLDTNVQIPGFSVPIKVKVILEATASSKGLSVADYIRSLLEEHLHVTIPDIQRGRKSVDSEMSAEDKAALKAEKGKAAKAVQKLLERIGSADYQNTQHPSDSNAKLLREATSKWQAADNAFRKAATTAEYKAIVDTYK